MNSSVHNEIHSGNGNQRSFFFVIPEMATYMSAYIHVSF